MKKEQEYWTESKKYPKAYVSSKGRVQYRGNYLTPKVEGGKKVVKIGKDLVLVKDLVAEVK